MSKATTKAAQPAGQVGLAGQVGQVNLAGPAGSVPGSRRVGTSTDHSIAKKSSDTALGSIRSRLVWFFGLWCCGVLAIALLSLVLRWIVRASFG